MDAVVKRSIALIDAARKTTVPWPLDKPYDHPYHISSPSKNGTWQTITPPRDSSNTTNPATPKPTTTPIQKLALYSWNIDFMLPYASSRMNTAVRHLQDLVSKQPSEQATVIFLAECVPSDLDLLSADAWIQSTFALTDMDTSNWANDQYGTTTLIDRRLAIKDVFRVHFSKTAMERDGLFVDVYLGKDNNILRLCNTHLESLALEPPRRPAQMTLCAEYMHDPAVHSAVIAGDFNAIQPFDRTLHTDNGLKDAFLELSGREDDAEGGHTWGQQAATKQRDMFGTSRMDKAFFCGGVRCVSFERFGAGVELVDEGERREVVELGFDRPWITDHLGIKAVFEVDDEPTHKM